MADRFILAHPLARRRALQAVAAAAAGHVVTIKPPKRTDDQNRRFHAMVADVARSGMEWAGKRRTPAEWKVLLVSGHAVVTKEGVEIIPGLEAEFVSIRESTALMSVKRGASLIDYVFCFGNEHGIAWSEPMPEATP